MSNLKKLALTGAFWTLVGYGGSQIIRFAGNLLLTRLLFPELFGLMGIVNVFLVGLALFSDVGIGISIVQNKRGEEPAFANTAWTVQVIRGVVLWSMCLVFAFPLAIIYDQPQLKWLIPIVGLTTLISGFDSTSLGILQRRLSLKETTFVELGTQFTHISVMLIWAYFSPTIWALVVGGLVSVIVRLVWSHCLLVDRPNRFTWDKGAVRELFDVGRWVFISTAFTFLAEQSDRLLLGKLFPIGLFGIYGIALLLSDVPRQVAVAVSGKVIFPAISQLTDIPRHELRAKLLRNRQKLLLLLTLGMTILVSFGDQIVMFLYDDRYLDAAWMLPILALGIWPRLLCSTIDVALISIGQLQYGTIGNFTRLTFTVVGILIGYHWFGNVGAVSAVALNDLAYYLVIMYGLSKEKLGCIAQDLKVTAMLFIGIALMVVARTILGIDFPFESIS
ncbi:polysaccharide biosynthesis protein [filamentous cyanobacterium CCP2]|nr:polysaccharide biosynthesis protein [filamentous cyanobacterium CCP2]